MHWRGPSENGWKALVNRQTALSMNKCIDACYQYNWGNGGNGERYAGVTYNANITSIVDADQGDCSLKSAVGIGVGDESGLVESVGLLNG